MIPDQISILFVEDSKNDCDLILMNVRENGYEPKFVRVETEIEMVRAIDDGQFDVILCDHNLPDFDVYSALAIAQEKLPNTPFIVVSGTVSESVAVKALKLGARDYILKNNLSRLVPSISKEIEEAKIRASRTILEAELQKKEIELRQAQKLEAIGLLAGGIAHDFNNMIAVIFLQAEVALEKFEKNTALKEQAETVYNSLDQIKKTGERAASLTRQLLAFSRKQVVQPQVLNINKVIQDLQKMLSRVIEENINLKFDLDKSCQNVKIDPGHLEQIVINLVVNARDAMSYGGLVSVKTENVKVTPAMESKLNIPQGQYSVLRVADTGCGISEENLKHIFEPFFTTKEVGKGTGLGLSTVYGIIKQNNGFIHVDSKINQGTAFTIYFLTSEEPAFSVLASVEPTALKGSETVLVVEDDEALRAAISETLTEQGYVVVRAADGTEALEIIKNGPPQISLVIADVLMPKMGGLELAEKAGAINFKAQFLFLSGYSEDTLLQQGISSGKTHFLEKPFKVKVLLNKIRNMLEAG